MKFILFAPYHLRVFSQQMVDWFCQWSEIFYVVEDEGILHVFLWLFCDVETWLLGKYFVVRLSIASAINQSCRD